MFKIATLKIAKFKIATTILLSYWHVRVSKHIVRVSNAPLEWSNAPLEWSNALLECLTLRYSHKTAC